MQLGPLFLFLFLFRVHGLGCRSQVRVVAVSPGIIGRKGRGGGEGAVKSDVEVHDNGRTTVCSIRTAVVGLT